MREFIIIHELVNPETGKTIKEENLEKPHNIPLYTLVEYRDARGFVAFHSRDCDGSPLYDLAWEVRDVLERESDDDLIARLQRSRRFNYIGEESLTVIMSADDVKKKYADEIEDA